MKKALAILVILFCLVAIHATTVKEILDNPGKWMGQTVYVEGYVQQWVPNHSGASYYIFKGDFGGIINVNSEDYPETGKRYKIKGLVQKDPASNKPLLAEINRELVGPIEIKPETKPQPQPSWFEENLLIVVLIGLAIVFLLILSSYLLFFRNRQSEINSKKQGSAAHTGFLPRSESKTEWVQAPRHSDTLIIAKEYKTMIAIPGRFEIVSEDDRGKVFPIPGYQTAKGNETTIGREQVKGERANAHIQIADKFETVSRKQAVVIERNRKVYIKNLSTTNPTQVNGRELGSNEMIELNFDDIIKMGYLEFKYRK